MDSMPIPTNATFTHPHRPTNWCYHPSDGDKYSMISHILDCLDQTSHQHPNLGIILVGDFNQLPDQSIRSYPLRQVVVSATRGKALLEKIFANMYDW